MAPGAVGDRFDDVVDLHLRPLLSGRDEMQQVAVAYALGVQGRPALERRAVRAAQDPTAVRLAVVGEPDTRVPQNLGQQIGQGYVLRQRDVDAAVRRADGDQGEASVHRSSSIAGGAVTRARYRSGGLST